MSCNCNGSGLDAAEPGYGTTYLKTLLAVGIVLTPVVAILVTDSSLRRRGRGRSFEGWGSRRHNVTKSEAYQAFKSEILPEVRHQYERSGRPDKPARREAWNNYIDALIRSGNAPESAGNWAHPRGL